VVVGAWIALLGVVVGAGVLGRGGEPRAPDGAGPSARTAVDASAPAGSLVARAFASAVAPPIMPERLTMTIPAARNVTVTSAAVDIAGTLDGEPGRVVVTLESRGSQLLDSRTVLVRDGRFHAAFDLPNPRPGGRMFVSVVLLAADGTPLEAIRRPIVSGPLTPRSLGADGLVGGIVFGTPMSERTRQD
jgi:hypothetical protein